MSLTAGATLQNHKYAVQKQLYQSDFGVTYQADHSILGRPVVLQTLNDSLRQRHDFAQLRQQFLNRVRAIAQQPVNNLHVLDCFEEDGLPFVVFELAPGQPLPQFTDWIPIVSTEAASNSFTANDLAVTAQPNASASAPANPPAVAARATGTPAHTTTSQDALTAPAAAPLVSQTHRAKPRPPVASSPVITPVLEPVPSHRAWMPLLLLFISMLGGLLGVGLGFFWRFSSARDEAGTPTRAAQNLTPRLFSREQSFPSEADWPISETPQIFTPDPIAVEAPDPSSAGYLAPYRPLPAEVNLPAPLPPVQPSELPPVAQPEPPVSPSPLPDPLPPAVGTAPSPEPIELPSPAEATTEPLPPAPIELPLPAPAPVIELPPSKQPKVFRN